MNRKYYVYGYIRLDTNTYFYIGKGTGRRYKRTDINNRNPHFVNIINKVNYKVILLKENLSQEEALNLEQFMINLLINKFDYSIDIKGFERKKKHLVNMSLGGDGCTGYKHTEEALEKMSNASKGRPSPMKGKNRPKEDCEKISANAKINPNYGMKGKHHSEESIQKMIKTKSEREYHYEISNEHKSKISASKIGHEVSQETRDKISDTLKGKMTGNKNGNSKQIICITTDEIFECSRDACKKYNLQPANLCRALKKHKPIKGLLFEYYITCND